MSDLRCRCLFVVLAVIATLAPTLASAAEGAEAGKGYPPRRGGLPILPPSENADRRGSYRVATSHAGYDYLVTVPGTYDPQRPVGLYIFFHGQGGHNAAAKGWGVPDDTIAAYNLIGLNMIYTDGDNASDTAGKVEAAKEALAQVMADYPVVPGRGVISSFSGGGLPHGLLMSQLGRGGPGDRGYHWPFCHSALYGSNFRVPARGTIPMTWVVAVGQNEWDLAGLGSDASARIAELAAMAAAGASPDFTMRVEAGKGHKITGGDHAATRAMFRRSDLMIAPFVHFPDYRFRELRSALQACAGLQYGRALAALDDVLDDDGLEAEVRAAAQRLRGIVADRAEAIAVLIEDLVGQDPLLAVHYGRIALDNHLRGHPARERVAAAVEAAGASEGYQALSQVSAWWFEHCAGLVRGGNLVGEVVEPVTQIHDRVPERSLIGVWSGELLQLQ